MVRSEKENKVTEKYTLAEMAKHMRNRYEDKDCYEYEVLTKAIKLFEGEPRYSVAELEKVFQYLVGLEKNNSYEWDVDYFLEFLKESMHVEAILK